MNREELFDKHLRNDLSEAEAAELKRLLATDADAGRAFVEHVSETALLVRVGSQLQSGRPPGNILALNEEVSAPRAKRYFRRVAALAACLAALVSIVVVLNRPGAPARIAEVHVAGAGVQVMRGDALLNGSEIELQAGDVITTPTNQSAVIVYTREATRLELQPGTVLEFLGPVSGKRFRLRAGIVEARVAPQPPGQPLRIQTAQAEATVLGTEFLLRADDRGTRIDVLEGKVEMACRTSGKKSVVKSGFAATLSPNKPFMSVAPLCSSNCILRECRGTNASSKLQKLKTRDEK